MSFLKHIYIHILLLAAFVATTSKVVAQDNIHKQSDGYVWPTQPAVLDNLHQWQDLKKNGSHVILR